MIRSPPSAHVSTITSAIWPDELPMAAHVDVDEDVDGRRVPVDTCETDTDFMGSQSSESESLSGPGESDAGECESFERTLLGIE